MRSQIVGDKIDLKKSVENNPFVIMVAGVVYKNEAYIMALIKEDFCSLCLFRLTVSKEQLIIAEIQTGGGT